MNLFSSRLNSFKNERITRAHGVSIDRRRHSGDNRLSLTYKHVTHLCHAADNDPSFETLCFGGLMTWWERGNTEQLLPHYLPL
jgi:hypothetical protein